MSGASGGGADKADASARLARAIERLTGDAGEADWRATLGQVAEALLERPLRELVDTEALARGLDAALSPELAEGLLRPLALAALPVVLREVRGLEGTVGDHVPQAARADLEALAARPGLAPERLLKELAEKDAVDGLMRDVLYDALTEFMKKVNPFFADWGLPSLLKRFAPFGALKGLEALKAELDKRMEPEIRAFLQTFARHSLRRLVTMVIASADEPRFLKLRVEMLRWLFAQRLPDLTRAIDAEAVRLGLSAELSILAAEAGRDDQRARRRRLLDEALAAFGDVPVKDTLAALGVKALPDAATLEAVAAGTFPLLRAGLRSAPARAWLGRLLDDLEPG